MDPLNIGLGIFVGICIFMAGRASAMNKQKGEHNSLQIVLSESALVNNPLQETSFRIEGEYQLELPSNHPHHKHTLYVLNFETDPEYTLRTVMLPVDVIGEDDDFKIPFDKYRFKLNGFGRIVAIVPEHYIDNDDTVVLVS